MTQPVVQSAQPVAQPISLSGSPSSRQGAAMSADVSAQIFAVPRGLRTVAVSLLADRVLAA